MSRVFKFDFNFNAQLHSPNPDDTTSSDSGPVLPDVPQEILERVAGWLESKTDLNSFTLVCRAWRLPGQHALFREMRVNLSQYEFHKHRKFFDQYPHLAASVRVLKLDLDGVADIHWIEVLVKRLSGLQTLRIFTDHRHNFFTVREQLPDRPPRRTLARLDIMNYTPERNPHPPIVWKYICVLFAPVEIRLIGVRDVDDGFYQCSLTAKSLHLIDRETLRTIKWSGCKFPSLQSLAIDLCEEREWTAHETLENVSAILSRVGSGLHNLTVKFGRALHTGPATRPPTLSDDSLASVEDRLWKACMGSWKDVEFYHCTSLRTLHVQVPTRLIEDDDEATADKPDWRETGWHYLETVLSQLPVDLEALLVSVDKVENDRHFKGQLKAEEWASLQQLILSRFSKLKHFFIMKEETEGVWGDHVRSLLTPSEKEIVEDTMPMLSAAGLIRFE